MRRRCHGRETRQLMAQGPEVAEILREARVAASRKLTSPIVGDQTQKPLRPIK